MRFGKVTPNFLGKKNGKKQHSHRPRKINLLYHSNLHSEVKCDKIVIFAIKENSPHCRVRKNDTPYVHKQSEHIWKSVVVSNQSGDPSEWQELEGRKSWAIKLKIRDYG